MKTENASNESYSFSEAELLRVTLASIGDAVITTDRHGKVTFLNIVAQTLTGWTQAQAVGHDLTRIFHIVNQDTRAEVENPALRALREGLIIGLANHTLLISKDGTERNIDDSAAPIKNEKGEVAGSVLVFRDITERYKAEAVKAHLAAIVASSEDAIIGKDLSGVITSWNEGAQRLFGYRVEEVVGKSVTLLIPADHIEEESEILRRIGRGERIQAYETVRQRKDGSRVDVSLAVSPVKDATGKIIGAAKIARNITERKNAEKQFQASETRNGAVIRGALDCIIKMDQEGRIVEFNPAAERTFGYRREDVVGKQMADLLIPPSMREHHRKGMAHYLATGEGPILGKRIEVMALRADGTEFPVELSVTPIPVAGKPLFAAFLRDITNRKRMEQELSESEVRYRRLFQAAKDGILILDAKTGKVTDANAFMGGLVGVEEHELLGKELHEIGLFANAEESKRVFRELQESKYVRYEHLPVQKRTGGTVEVEVVANIYQEDHRLVAQCNVRDISQRVAMEKKIKEQAEELAGESRRKDEFLAMLSHELRNPLAPIRSAMHLLRTQERVGSEDIIQRQAHEVIDRQVVNLTKIVSDLLEVSRVISGRIRLSQQTVDLNQVVQHAAETTAPLFKEHNHELVLNLCPDHVWTNADPTRMEEVFVNLLNNAAKYTPDGGRIEVWCEQPRGADFVQFRVRDNGMGIDQDMLPRIFDLFTQADRSLARSAGGLGIGLSLAHRLVELHGGTIEAHSPPEGTDIGSEFVVRLPLVPHTFQPKTAESAPPAVNSDGIRILLVDDNLDLVMMFSTSLRRAGYSVQAAYTGPDGLKVARQWRPDVVLLDIGLPGLDGYEVARRLRSDPQPGNAGKQVRLIALTGYGRDTDLALAREAGFDGHLIKPVEFKDLEKMIAGPPQ